jgi:hypothetical protein
MSRIAHLNDEPYGQEQSHRMELRRFQQNVTSASPVCPVIRDVLVLEPHNLASHSI